MGNGTITAIKTASYGSDAAAIARVLIGFEQRGGDRHPGRGQHAGGEGAGGHGRRRGPGRQEPGPTAPAAQPAVPPRRPATAAAAAGTSATQERAPPRPARRGRRRRQGGPRGRRRRRRRRRGREDAPRRSAASRRRPPATGGRRGGGAEDKAAAPGAGGGRGEKRQQETGPRARPQAQKQAEAESRSASAGGGRAEAPGRARQRKREQDAGPPRPRPAQRPRRRQAEARAEGRPRPEAKKQRPRRRRAPRAPPRPAREARPRKAAGPRETTPRAEPSVSGAAPEAPWTFVGFQQQASLACLCAHQRAGELQGVRGPNEMRSYAGEHADRQGQQHPCARHVLLRYRRGRRGPDRGPDRTVRVPSAQGAGVRPDAPGGQHHLPGVPPSSALSREGHETLCSLPATLRCSSRRRFPVHPDRAPHRGDGRGGRGLVVYEPDRQLLTARGHTELRTAETCCARTKSPTIRARGRPAPAAT